MLAARLTLLPELVNGDEATEFWTRLGVPNAERVPDMNVDALLTLRAN
jgi:malonate decarboxylase beta subunit